MANYVYIAASLDGFIASKEGGIEWLYAIPNPNHSDYRYAEFIKDIDAIVMGRNTHEKVLTFGEWPYAVPVFVLSRRLKKIHGTIQDKVEVICGDLGSLIDQLNKRGYHNLYIDGGVTIQSFLLEDLIDEMIITRIPILLGDGLPLFDRLEQSLLFKHKKQKFITKRLSKAIIQETDRKMCLIRGRIE